MNTTATSSGVGSKASSRLFQLALAGMLGLFVVGFAGMAPVSALHNAAHDYRHSVGFPCH